MRMIQKKFNPSMKQYHLGELVLNAHKVNYKLNYRPGLLLCPRTKQMIPFEKVKDKVIYYSKLPIEEKK